MPEEIQVIIGADPSSLIRETKRAGTAFSKFTDGLEKNSKGAEAALGSFGSATDKVADSAEDLVKASKKIGTGGAAQRLDKLGDAALGAAKDTDKTRDALGKFVKQASKAEKEAEELADALKQVGSGDLRGRLKSLGSLANNLGKRFGEAGNTALASAKNFALTGASAALKLVTAGVIALGVALVGIGIKSATAFAEFESEFAQVLTLIDDGQVNVEALGDGVRGLAQDFGVDLKDAVQATYQEISAGGDPAKTVEFLGTAFKAAAAGGATAKESVDLLTSSLNAYGKPVTEAARVSDILLQTVKSGKTTFSELAANIGAIAPGAASAGVSLEELTGAVAALTSVGLSTAEAGTQIGSFIRGISQAGPNAAAALAEIGVTASSLREEGLAATFEKIRNATNGATTGLKKFLPDIRAGRAAALLAGTGFDKLRKSIDANEKATGTTGRAFEKVAKTLQFQFNQISSTVENVFVSLGKLIAPSVQQAAGLLANFAKDAQADLELLGDAFSSRFGPEIEKFFEGLGGSASESSSVVADGLNAIGSGLVTVSGFLRGSSDIFATFAAVLRGVGEGAVLVASALKVSLGVTIAALVTPTTLLLTALRALAEAVGAEGLAGTLRVGEDALKEFRSSLIDSATDAAQTATDAFDGLTTGVADTFDATKKASEDFADGLATVGRSASALGDDVSTLKRAQEGTVATATAAATAQRSLGVATTEAGAASRSAAGDARGLAGGLQVLSGAAAEAAAAQDKAAEAADRLASSASGQEALARRFGESAISAEALAVSLGIATAGLTNFSAAFDVRRLTPALKEASVVASELTGALRVAGVAAATSLAEGRTKAEAFKTTVLELKAIGSSFLDTTVIDRFAEAGGFATLDVRRLKVALDEVRVVSNVLTGDFKKTGIEAVKAYATGEKSAARFKETIAGLAAEQLGLTELFRSASDLAKGFEDLGAAADVARGKIGTGIRSEVERLRTAFDAGEIKLDGFIEGIREAGEAADRFRSLSDLQVVAVQRLGEENQELADTIVSLAGNLDGTLKPAFDAFLQANRQGKLDTEELSVAIESLAAENDRLANSARGAADGLEKQADATEDAGKASAKAAKSAAGLNKSITGNTKSLASFLREATRGTPLEDTLTRLQQRFDAGKVSGDSFKQGLESVFGAIAVGNQQFVDATEAARLFEAGQESLIPKISELGSRLNELGRNQLNVLIENFDGTEGAVQRLRASLQQLADTAQSAGRQTSSGLESIAAFGRPGRLQISNNASGGSQLLGLQGRATGSANFTNALEADLGSASGLAPKALRSAIGRAGGIGSFVRERGIAAQFAGRFAAAGPISSTGFAQVEAGEFVLGQRGQTELGKLVAGALNGGGQGAAPPQVNQTNNFNVQADGAFGANSVEELAFMLAPALANARNLGAAQSPYV